MTVHPLADVRGRVSLGAGTSIDAFSVLGAGDGKGATSLGERSRVRSHSVVYSRVRAGKRFETGHHVVIREGTRIGDDVLVGSGTIIEGETVIGSRVSIQSRVFIPASTRIGNDVFIGPAAILTNDRYPLRVHSRLRGPIIADGVSIGAGAIVLPAVRIGRGSFVAAGAVVTRDVPPKCLAIGVPARFQPLPASLATRNRVRRRR